MLNTLFEQAGNPQQSTILRRLRDEGYDEINKSGNTFVCCMARADSDHVILTNIDTYSAPHFYRFCAQNNDNPYLPRIHDLKIFEGFSLVKMERLTAVDHYDIADRDKALLEEKAPALIRYIRGESSNSEMADIRTRDPLHERTVREILQLSRDIYQRTNGETLPFCDVKPDNIFLRHTAGGAQLVYGDPLFPGMGANTENRQMMEQAYRRFDLPPLPDLRRGPAPEFRTP